MCRSDPRSSRRCSSGAARCRVAFMDLQGCQKGCSCKLLIFRSKVYNRMFQLVGPWEPRYQVRSTQFSYHRMPFHIQTYLRPRISQWIAVLGTRCLEPMMISASSLCLECVNVYMQASFSLSVPGRRSLKHPQFC
jgi:hypothetical protein